MKALVTFALIATGLTLSSCTCKDGKCSMNLKKKAPAACTSCCDASAKPAAHKH